MKKGMLLLFSIILMIGSTVVFAGGEQEAANDGPLTVRMLYPDNSSYPLNEDWTVFKAIKDATGVNLELIVAPDNSADFEAKKQIIFASGDIPEIVYSKYQAAAEDVSNGLLLPISDYLDQMPNLKGFLEMYDYSTEIANFTENDGKWYTLPVKADTYHFRIHSWMYRVDLFEKHGIPIPKTMEDVYKAGVKLKEIYPESRPIINRFGAGNILSILGGAWGTAAGWVLNTNGYTYDDATGEFVFAPASEEYRDMLRWIRKCYVAGVLDQEFASMESSTYEQLAAQGETFIFMDWVGNQVRYNVAGQKTNPDFEVAPAIPPKGPGGYAAERGSIFEQFWVIPASIKDNPRFEEILAFIDWFYSDEAQYITTFGVEGQTYKKEGGKVVFVDPKNDYSRTDGLLNNALNVRRHPDWFLAMNGPEVGELYKEMADLKVFRSPEPRIRFSIEEIEDLKLMVPGVKDYYDAMLHKFIFGEADLEADWDDYVSELKAKGSEEIGEIVKTAWNRQK